MKLYEIVFSPTGGTKRAADLLTGALGGDAACVDLTDSKQDFHALQLTREDVAVLAVPSYGGRVPAVAAERLKMLNGQGARAIPLTGLAAAAPGFDAVVNTVPALVLTRPVLGALRPGSLIVDLASRPGGTDFAAAAALGHTALPALSLPARCAPESAGEYVAGTVLEIIRERAEQEAAG